MLLRLQLLGNLLEPSSDARYTDVLIDVKYRNLTLFCELLPCTEGRLARLIPRGDGSRRRYFSMNNMDLIDTYHRDGVIRYRGLFDAAELAEIRCAYDLYQERVVKTLPPADYTLEPDGTSVRNFWRMQEHDPFFLDLARRPKLIEFIGPLVNGEVVLMAVETFNKPARVGSPVPPHQDNAYFCQSPPDVLTVWIALDAATEENGAVEYLLGSHHELLPHKPSGVTGNSMGLAEQPSETQFPLFVGMVNPGDALIHHCQTIHRSEPNRSALPRLSLLIVYRGAHTRTDESLLSSYRAAAVS